MILIRKSHDSNKPGSLILNILEFVIKSEYATEEPRNHIRRLSNGIENVLKSIQNIVLVIITLESITNC